MVLNLKVVALAGGVGGAKLADGLARSLSPGNLTIIVNTGDDFLRYGLSISPDLDTVMYTLAGLADPVNGWGLAGDTRQMVDMLKRYGDDAWFGLGDRDLATHLLRTQALAHGEPLSAITARLAGSLGVRSRLLPMSDDRVPTMVETVEQGILEFQEYFVHYRWQPTIKRVWYDNVERAHPAPGVIEELETADLIVICPSNPMLSVEPILRVSGVRSALEKRRIPCIAVSPIAGGKAFKGPAAKIMAELGMDVSPGGVAAYYGNLIDGLVVDTADRSINATQPIQATDIEMKTIEDRVRLAGEVLMWATHLRSISRSGV